MDFIRRYIFRGQASGVAAHIRRPQDQVFNVHAASSLPVTGGISTSTSGPDQLGRYLSFREAVTSAAGDFLDRDRAVAMTRGEVPFDAVPTLTVVKSRVTGVQVMSRLSIGSVSATLMGRSPENGKQPTLRMDVRIDNVVLDKTPLRITMGHGLLNLHDTQEKLLNALPGMSEGQRRRFAMPGDSAVSNGIIFCSIVEKMEWAGADHAKARIEGNRLIIPDFGSVSFGELL